MKNSDPVRKDPVEDLERVAAELDDTQIRMMLQPGRAFGPPGNVPDDIAKSHFKSSSDPVAEFFAAVC